jgi:hypothetical protein
MLGASNKERIKNMSKSITDIKGVSNHQVFSISGFTCYFSVLKFYLPEKANTFISNHSSFCKVKGYRIFILSYPTNSSSASVLEIAAETFLNERVLKNKSYFKKYKES